jgi:hemin uptake protein HemP
MTPLANKIAEIVDQTITSQDARVVWRNELLDEEWKVIVDYDGNTELITVRAQRRDNFGERGDA